MSASGSGARGASFLVLKRRAVRAAAFKVPTVVLPPSPAEDYMNEPLDDPSRTPTVSPRAAPLCTPRPSDRTDAAELGSPRTGNFAPSLRASSLAPPGEDGGSFHPANGSQPDLGRSAADQYRVALSLCDSGDWDGAHDVLTCALEAARVEFKQPTAFVANMHSQLGKVYGAKGDAAAAAAAHGEAVRILQDSAGAADALTREAMSDMAQALYAAGDLTAALEAFRSLLIVTEQVEGGEAPAVAVAKGNVAAVLRDAGEPQEALRLFDEALPPLVRAQAASAEAQKLMGRTAVATVAQGSLPPAEAALLAVADCRLNRAGALADCGRAQDAKHELEEVLRVRREVLGPDHTDTEEVEGYLRALQGHGH